MGELIREYNWNNTALGDPATWPQSLKTSVRLLLSSGHPMFIWWGPDLIQFYNDAYRRSVGLARHLSALGQGGRECWAEIWDMIGPQIELVMAGDGSTWHENHLVPITRRSGKREEVYWTYSYSPIDNPSSPNGIGGVLVICTEATVQVLAEQRKKAAELRWRELFNQSPGFMCILSGPQHIYEFANPRYFELLGGRELIGKTVRDAVPEVNGQEFEQLLDEVYRSGKAVSGMATPLSLARLGGNRHYLYVDFVYQPIVDANGEVTGIFVNGYDVTDSVLAKEILIEEDRRKDEFLAMLAHELRNPLAPIRNASELLIQTSTPGSNTRTIGDLIARQVTQLTHLVDELLDVSRITQGKIELQRESLLLDGVIQLVIESLQPLLTKKGQELIYEADEHALYIQGDMIRLIQCLTNVLMNAIKYTGVGGTIQLHLRSVDQMAVIEVIDNGIGISPEMLPRVFELFFQVDQSLERSQGGLGVGLSIVRRLVQMHGGYVTAMSDGLRRGSHFEICLPLIEEPFMLENNKNHVDEKLSSMRLLIVDDNVDSADSLALLLQSKGHKTITVYSAHEALALAEKFGADIVLLDIGLPEIDGYEVARRMRAKGSTSKLVALTGYGKPEDIQQALDAGFDAHMTKPIVFAELERMLERYC